MGISPNHPAILRAVERGLIRDTRPVPVRAPAPPPGCSEKQFQAAVVRLAKLHKWAVYHTWNSRKSDPGFPDLVLVRRGTLIFAELKRQTGRVTREQAEWFGLFDEVEGVHARLWYPSMWPAIVAELTNGGTA